MIVYSSGAFKGPISNFEIRKNSDPAPPPAKPWWTHKKLTCGICSCVFGIKETDAVLVSTPIKRGETPQISVLCPECRLLNRFCESDAEEIDPFEPVEPDAVEGQDDDNPLEIVEDEP